MKFTIWIIIMGLCLLCVGCATTDSDDKIPGLQDYGNKSMPEGGAQAADFAAKTY